MAWGLFAVVLLVTFLLQTTVLKHVPPHAVMDQVDLLLALALVCGFVLPAVEARLAGWIVGFAYDIHSLDPLGLHAFLFGLTVYALTHLREVANQQVWWARWVIAFVVAWPAQFLVQAYQRVVCGVAQTWSTVVGQSFLTALVAALLAAVIVGLPALLGSTTRRRYPTGRW
jgi:rod shape-determining protein MreD